MFDPLRTQSKLGQQENFLTAKLINTVLDRTGRNGGPTNQGMMCAA